MPDDITDDQLEEMASSIAKGAAFDVARWTVEIVKKYFCCTRFHCESPIERRFLLAMVSLHTLASMPLSRPDHFSFDLVSRFHSFDSEAADIMSDAANKSFGVKTIIQPQADLGSYRADFLIQQFKRVNDVFVASRKFVVECDGHDFHERTADQAEHDRSRDRAMTAMGYTVLRFTGRELWRDAWECANEVMEQLHLSYPSGGDNA